MVSSTLGKPAQVYELTEVQVISGSGASRVAAITLRHLNKGTEDTYSSVAEGPVQAVISAISQGISGDITFGDLELHSLSSGEDAHAEAAVTVEKDGKVFRGTAVHQDIVMAAGMAYVAACNSAVMSV
ncbi:2-isopropylmalate synthase [Paenibacillus sp. JCM 10914]|nr:2-isopropylmalate synthase [Paenibacillus sp. JCM 10914]